MLDSVAFRADKNVFLNKQELARTVASGRKKRNPNPNRKYDTLLLLDDEQMRNVGTVQLYNLERRVLFLVCTTTDSRGYKAVRMVLLVSGREEKEMSDFIKSLHIGTRYDI